jgi:4-hydroxybenzoate polyprenyltransferase
MAKKLWNYWKEFILSLENKEIPFSYFLLTFLFIVTMRNFLEVFSCGTSISSDFIHYYLFYISLCLSMILLFYFATGENLLKISRVVLTGFFIIISPPLIDLILTSGKGYILAYLLPGLHHNIILKFFTFFGPFEDTGVSAGIRIEVALVITASFTYFIIKTGKILRSIFFAFLVYTLIFIYIAIPFFILPLFYLLQGSTISDIINIFASYRKVSDLFVIFFNHIFIFLSLIVFLVIVYLYRKEYVVSLLKDLRFFRVIHFESMFIGGIIIGKFSSFHFPVKQAIFSPEKFFPFVFTIFSIVMAWLFSVITNNIEDRNIDSVSNRERPSVTEKIPSEFYKTTGWIVLLLSVISAISANFSILFLIFLFMGNYFLYSMPPVRFKRVPFFSKIIPSINSFIILLTGYVFLCDSLRFFPGEIIFFFLIFVTASMNFIDIKDYEGDKKGGIKTLPVLMGLEKSKILIGLFFLISYIAAYYLLDFPPYGYLLIIPGLIQFFLINRKNYSEEPLFIVYFITLILIIIISGDSMACHIKK